MGLSAQLRGCCGSRRALLSFLCFLFVKGSASVQRSGVWLSGDRSPGTEDQLVPPRVPAGPQQGELPPALGAVAAEPALLSEHPPAVPMVTPGSRALSQQL